MSRSKAKKLLARLTRVQCRKIGDRWYVTYGGVIRNDYAHGSLAIRNAFAVGDLLREEQDGLQEVASEVDAQR